MCFISKTNLEVYNIWLKKQFRIYFQILASEGKEGKERRLK